MELKKTELSGKGRKLVYDAPNLGEYAEFTNHLSEKGVSFKEVSDNDGSVRVPTISIYDRHYDEESLPGIEPVGIIRIKHNGLYAQIADFRIADVVETYLDGALTKKV